jgi:hypothetical protein
MMILTVFASVLKLHRLDDSTPLGKYRIGGGNRETTATALIQNTSLKGLEPPWNRPVPPRLPE